MRPIVTCVLLLSLVSPTGVARAAGDAPRAVRAGVEQFVAGRFQEAAETFAKAQEAWPDDLRVTFDLACAKAAAGRTDEAVELLRKASVAKDPALAARCHYNLGQIAVERARATLGGKPEDAPPEARAKAIEQLAAAQGHWRDCLAAEPGHEDARYNLELARLYGDNLEATWKDRDRQKRRDSMDLAKFLDWLITRQRELRGSTGDLTDLPKSPKQRLAFHRAKLAERELGEEIEPLRQKIAQALSSPPEGAGAAPPGSAAAPTLPPEERQRAIEVLSQLATGAGESIRAASEHLAELSVVEARRAQADAIEKLDEIAAVPRPYPELVRQCVQKQEGLVDTVSSVSAGPTPRAQKDQDAKLTGQAQPAEAKPAGTKPVDLPETAWEQRFVERWAQIVVGKARQGLKSMSPPPSEQPTAPVPPASQTNPSKPEQAVSSSDPQQAAAETARRQQEGLRKSMELAVKLGPKVRDLSAQAAADLDGGRRAEALPKQQEALRLLREIAKPLQQPSQNQQHQQNQQQNQDQKNQDQNQDKNKNEDQKEGQDKQNQDQKKDDQRKKDQEQKDQGNKNDENKDEDRQDQQDEDPKKSDQDRGEDRRDEADQKQPRQARPRDLSKEQAEVLMRQVRQRQREKDDAEKAIRLYLSRPENVEKDW